MSKSKKRYHICIIELLGHSLAEHMKNMESAINLIVVFADGCSSTTTQRSTVVSSTGRQRQEVVVPLKLNSQSEDLALV